MKIKRKLAIGYTVIVALIGGIVYTYLREWRQMNKLESEVKQIHELRRNIRDAYAHMLDLTMFGETILEWKDADTATYRAKRLEVDSILCRFKNYYSGERIDSLRGLMAEKETQLFYISKLFEQQQELSEELAERVPVIAYESTQEPKTKGGFLGLFKKKDKSLSATSTQLYTLNRDVIKKQSEQSRRLSATADSLAHRNLHINQKLKNLITVMDERITADLQQREQEIIETRERTKISIGAITAFLFLSLALSYFVIMRDYGRKERGSRKLEASNRKNADEIIKNTYRTLMTRGMKGCYVYFCDKALEKHFKSLLEERSEIGYDNKLRIEPTVNDEVKFIDFLPLYSIKAACGYFGDGDNVEVEGWVRVEGVGRLNRNMYVVQAVGDSMEPLIQNGDYCVFRANPAGSRQGKIILAQHHNKYDPDYSGSYSIKTYTSKKNFDEYGNWMHEEIVLQPKNSAYDPIIINDEDVEDFRIVGEFVTKLVL